MENVQAIKGMNDILPGAIHWWHMVEGITRELLETFGYREMRTPLLERTELFARSIGESTDIVEKEMYTFTDQGGQSLTLRPEATASMVRAFIQHHLHSDPSHRKFYAIGAMFRHERPQKGRYRQFHQIDAEVFGVEEPMLDAELMYMLRLLLERVGLSGMVLHINSLGCPACRPAYREELRHYLEAQGEGFCPDCRRRRTTNALRVFDCKVERCQELLGDAPVLLEHLCTACLEHFGAVKGCLQQLTTDYRINPRMVRGLDYYTRTTFEIITDQLGAQNAVGGGGRYDGLMRDLGGPDLPGIGFAIGMERLILLVQQQKQGLARRLTLFVATLGAAARARGFALVQELRRLGVETEMDYGESSLKSQMRRADRLGARHVLILGTDELASGTAQLRDMADKGQISIPLAQATEILYRTLAAGHLPHRHEHGRKPAGDEGS